MEKINYSKKSIKKMWNNNFRKNNLWKNIFLSVKLTRVLCVRFKILYA